jgi:hypothetical protein
MQYLLAARIYTMDAETGAMNELTTDSAQAPLPADES